MPHILFVDNDLGSLVLFEEICRQEGIHYTCLNNSSQIYGAISDLTDVSAIFVDLEMPHPNGYEVLKHLRSIAKFRSLPIVACTVHSAEIDRAREAGFSSFIPKPLNIDKFPDQLRAIMRGQEIWAIYSD